MNIGSVMKAFGVTVVMVGAVCLGLGVTPLVAASVQADREVAASGNLQASETVAPAQPVRAKTAPLAPMDPQAMTGLRDATASYYLAPGETLRGALTRWCADSDYQLVWQSDQDFVIDSQMSFPRGVTFDEAVRQTVRAVWRQHPTLKAETYKNRVLVVSSHEVSQ